jgi:hypothetical protein
MATSIKYPKIIYEDDQDCLLIQHSLTDPSQLINLEVYQKEPGGSFPHGETWEQMITTSIPIEST